MKSRVDILVVKRDGHHESGVPKYDVAQAHLLTGWDFSKSLHENGILKGDIMVYVGDRDAYKTSGSEETFLSLCWCRDNECEYDFHKRIESYKKAANIMYEKLCDPTYLPSLWQFR